MNFLGAMGGIGAGITAGAKDWRDADEAKQKQEETKQRNAESDLRMKQIQMGITKAQKEVDDSKAYGEIASGDQGGADGQGSQAILPSAARPPAAMASAGLSRVGESLPIMPDIAPASGATATEGMAAGAAVAETKQPPAGATPASMRKTFQKMANAALIRGDMDAYQKFSGHVDHVKKVEDEGVLDIAKMIHLGNVNPAEAERAFNAAGNMRVVPGSVKWDAATGTLSGVDASTGQPASMDKQTAQRYLVMSGAIKPEEYSSAGDGQVFNKLTGEVKGTPRSNHKPIVVNGAIFEQQDDGSGGVNYAKVAEAPKQPSVVVHQGGDSLTTPQQRTNASIEAARTAIGGMSREELQKKTAKFTMTGRENPSYDPRLDGLWKQATSRKYGDDPHHDAFTQRSAQANQPQQQPSHQQRFSADPAMKGMRLGKQTDRGVEVLDANGRLVGHYN